MCWGCREPLCSSWNDKAIPCPYRHDGYWLYRDPATKAVDVDVYEVRFVKGQKSTGTEETQY